MSKAHENKWISVKDKLPELDCSVLVSDGTIVTYMTYDSNKYSKNGKPRFLWHGRVGFPWVITHWMPLPEPPEDQK